MQFSRPLLACIFQTYPRFRLKTHEKGIFEAFLPPFLAIEAPPGRPRWIDHVSPGGCLAAVQAIASIKGLAIHIGAAKANLASSRAYIDHTQNIELYKL